MVGSTSAGAIDRYPAHCTSVYSTVKGRYWMRWCLLLSHPLIDSQAFFQASDSDPRRVRPKRKSKSSPRETFNLPNRSTARTSFPGSLKFKWHHWVLYSKQWANQPQEWFFRLLYFNIYFSVLTKVSQVHVSNAKQMPFCFHSLEEI